MVIAQRPNLAAKLALLGYGASWLFAGFPKALAWIVGAGALAIWALLEILSGVNWFRRLLGIAGLALFLGSLINALRQLL